MPPLPDILAQMAFGLVFFLIFTLLPAAVLCSTMLVFSRFRSPRHFGLLLCSVLLLHLACYAGLRVSGVLYAYGHQGSFEIDMNSDGDLTSEMVELTFAGYGFIEAPFAGLYTPPPTGG